jgi:nucleotide-binding universal stress UspA family protein
MAAEVSTDGRREVAVAETPDGIIAGYDGSPGSEQALRWAAREGQARGTALTVCLAWAPDSLARLDEAAVLDLARQRGEEILASGLRFAESVLGSGRVRPLLARGSAAHVLTEHSGSSEMVVVGYRGHGGVPGVQLGSVARQVAGHGQGRVVVVRGQWRPVNQAPGPVVAGADGSAASQAAVGFAFEEAALRHVPLVAVCALSDAPGRLGGARQMEEDFGRSMDRWEKEHPEVTVQRQVANGSPRAALLEAAAQAQMLVVGAHGLGDQQGMALGSVAQAALCQAPCPVGVARPPAHLP